MLGLRQKEKIVNSTQEQKIIFQYPKLKARLQERGNLKEERQVVIKNHLEIRADYSETYIKNFRRMLDATLPSLYDGINFNENGIDFNGLVKENCVVLVPNHQSHVDYLAINYMVYKNYGFPLYVAGGNNLNIFPVGKMFRKSGCFFIRRSFTDDVLYKLTMEAYLYFLLMHQRPIEFFFEGGRSRTGKLRPPRYGLFNMILEAHASLPEERKKPLVFVPTSIAHEYVPDAKAMSKELKGAKKAKESPAQVFGLVRLLSYQFGNVHINLGGPIYASVFDRQDARTKIHHLAFTCFRQVGRNMVVTPSSLLAFILLDEPSGILRWSDIFAQANQIVDYCLAHQIPVVDGIRPNKLADTLGRALDMMIGNGKVEVIGKNTVGHPFYSIKAECRSEILYFKNTILHHFMVPYIINLAWINLFTGEIKNVSDLKSFFLEQRKRLKHEFYLPTVRTFLVKTLEVVSRCVGRKIEELHALLDLSHQELYAIASRLGVFSRSYSYIFEAYYVAGLSLKKLNEDTGEGIKEEDYLKASREVFDSERRFSKVLRFSESYALPLMESALLYYQTEKVVQKVDDRYVISHSQGLNSLVGTFQKELLEQLKFNIRVE